MFFLTTGDGRIESILYRVFIGFLSFLTFLTESFIVVIVIILLCIIRQLMKTKRDINVRSFFVTRHVVV